MLNRQGEDFRNLIGVDGTDGASKRRKPPGGCLDDKQRLSSSVHTTLPPKERLDMWQDVDARSQALVDQGARKPLAVPTRWTGDQDDEELFHWIIDSLGHLSMTQWFNVSMAQCREGSRSETCKSPPS